MIQTDETNSFRSSRNHSQSISTPTNMTQTSTLIISAPRQYHYYLYPTKKNHSRMNSTSTNSSSSSDPDDETYSQTKKPIILSDSVQNFWPPPPSPSQLNNEYEQVNLFFFLCSSKYLVFCFSSRRTNLSFSRDHFSLPSKIAFRFIFFLDKKINSNYKYII